MSDDSNTIAVAPERGGPALRRHLPSRGLADRRRVGGGADRREVTRRRDALFRRSLAVADMAAVGIAVLGMVQIESTDSLKPLALIIPFVFIAVVKAMGLYDRDEHVLHRSTLDEIPALFS